MPRRTTEGVRTERVGLDAPMPAMRHLVIPPCSDASRHRFHHHQPCDIPRTAVRNVIVMHLGTTVDPGALRRGAASPRTVGQSARRAPLSQQHHWPQLRRASRLHGVETRRAAETDVISRQPIQMRRR